MPAGDCQCPKIDLEEWRDREVSLMGHAFVSAATPLFLHVPRRLHDDLEALLSQVDGRRYRAIGSPLVLHRDGWFSGEVLLSIDPESGPREEIRTFRTVFYSRVAGKPGFDAALREVPRFYRDLRAARVGRISAMYFWYLSCPRCLLERGAQQIILLAESNKVFAAQPCPMEASVLPCPQV